MGCICLPNPSPLPRVPVLSPSIFFSFFIASQPSHPLFSGLVLLHLLTDSGGGPVDSPVQWREAFIGPVCSALPETNGIQMWPSIVVTATIYGERERERANECDCV